jgi:hypothetical protein
MTVHPGDSLDKLLLRERLFARLRLAGLALLAAVFVLYPRPIGVPLVLALQVIGAGFMLSLAAWALLRFRRISRIVTLLSAGDPSAALRADAVWGRHVHGA